MSAAFKTIFTKRFFPTEVYPLAGIVVIMSSAASFMVYHVSQDSDVVWNHTGDCWHPWDKVKPDQDLKLYQRNPEWWAKYRASNPTHQGFLNTTTYTRPAAPAAAQ